MNKISKVKALSSDVFVTEETYPSIGRPEMEFLRQSIESSSRGRVRLCTHKVNEDRQHEMFISFADSNYVRPSWHIGKDESMLVLKGDADYIFFDKIGRVIDTVPLGTYWSGRQFYCRIPALAEHALVIRSKGIEIHETTVGPFKREDTVFSPWSAEEGETARVKQFLAEMLALPRPERPLLKMQRTGQEVFVAAEHIVSVGKKEMDFLKKTVHETDRKRVRLCAHKEIENTLHEMFVVYMSMPYVKPNKHINKDESLHILEGEADFIFFDEQGNITAIIPLGDYNSGRQFYIRVPAFVYHTIIMKSETLVIHEVTPGPLRREETVWAPWAPQETDIAAVGQFMNRLHTAVKAKSC